MTEEQGAYIPESEPSEVAVLRYMLTRMDVKAEEAARYGDKMLYREKAALQRIRTEANALRACMKAAGWSVEPPSEEDEQHLWSAG